jgi:glycosyltransferase involved in cell wall biosynthesis
MRTSLRFSILLPTYNIEKYIRQTIDSLLSQNFTDYEIVVVDDGSTDRTPEILESYGTRIKYFHQSNKGAEVARNQAASLASGEYFLMMDHDDILLPFALRTYDRVIRNCGRPPLIIGAMMYFQDEEPIPLSAEASVPVRARKFPNFLSKDVQVGVTNSRIVMRRTVFEEIGGYGNKGEPAFPSDDFNLIFKAGTHGPCVVVQEPDTIARRMHAANFVRNVGAVADGILGIVRLDKQGRFPGDKRHRAGRKAVIGGFSLVWAINYCWPAKQRRDAVRLLWGTAPMVAVAMWKRFLRIFRTPTPLITLPEERTEISSAVESATPEATLVK